jgi:uncharacterized caspase-like protein
MKKLLIVILVVIFYHHISYSQESVARSKSGSLEKPMPVFKLPTIWAVVVGVSKYQKEEMNLNYADKDAQLFYSHLSSPSGLNVPKENSTLLVNSQATRANILRAINEKCNKSFEDDLIILYLSGHGMPDPVGNEVYFLGYESEIDNLLGTAVSMADIEKALSRSKAKKKIWIADACHSGGAGLNIKGNQTYLTNKMFLELATAKEGCAVLTASSASELSKEGKDWGEGQGVFTYYLIEGLKGDADIDKDGIITIREIYEYISKKVIEATNGQQHPELKGTFDNKLPLGKAK